MVNELHKKLCKWLCENYRVILLPHFKAKQMFMKNILGEDDKDDLNYHFYDQRRSKISSKTTQNVLTWYHYRFRQRLLFKTKKISVVQGYSC